MIPENSNEAAGSAMTGKEATRDFARAAPLLEGRAMRHNTDSAHTSLNAGYFVRNSYKRGLYHSCHYLEFRKTKTL